MQHRRTFPAAALALTVALGFGAPASAQNPKVIKVGTLKLIHGITPYFYEKFTPAGYKIEVIPFESPTDGKNAVVTGTVDFGTFGIRGDARCGCRRADGDIRGAVQSRHGDRRERQVGDQDREGLKGKRVAIWPGSTQEVVILERLKAEGLAVKDIQAIRLPFRTWRPRLHAVTSDAYVGAEPGPGISLANGAGKIVEYPYSTAIGSLNMVWGARRETIEESGARHGDDGHSPQSDRIRDGEREREDRHGVFGRFAVNVHHNVTTADSSRSSRGGGTPHVE